MGSPATVFDKKSVALTILSFAPPMLAYSVMGALFSVADRWVLGRSGRAEDLSALTLATPATMLLFGAVSACACGTAVRMSLHLGEKNVALCRRACISGMYAGTVLPGAVAMLLALTAGAYLPLLSQARELTDPAAEYIRICALSAPAYGLGSVLSRALLADGMPWKCFLATFLSLCGKIACDLLWIPETGLQGAAYATVVSQILLAACGLIFSPGKSPSSIRFHELLRFDIKETSFILRAGLSQGVQQICCAGAYVAAAFAGRGDDHGALADLGGVIAAANLYSMPTAGFNQGAAPLTGYSAGAGRGDRMRACVGWTLLFSFAATLIPWALTLAFPKQAADIFAVRPDALKKYVSLIPLFAVSGTASNFFLAIERPLQAAILTSARQAVFLIPLLLTLSRIGDGRMTFWAGAANDLASCLISAALLIPALKESRRK